jgi:lysozyme family protein
MNKQLKAAVASYARSVLAAGSALYLAGVTDPAQLLNALLAGLLPVALRALNKNDPAFGLIEKLAQPHLAKLSNGETAISKEYIEKNKAAVEKLVSEAQKATKAQAAKAASKPAPKKPTPPKK